MTLHQVQSPKISTSPIKGNDGGETSRENLKISKPQSKTTKTIYMAKICRGGKPAANMTKPCRKILLFPSNSFRKVKETTRFSVGSDQRGKVKHTKRDQKKSYRNQKGIKRKVPFSSERKRRKCAWKNYLVRDRKRNERVQAREELRSDRSPRNREEMRRRSAAAAGTEILRAAGAARAAASGQWRRKGFSHKFILVHRKSLTRRNKLRFGSSRQWTMTRVCVCRLLALWFIFALKPHFFWKKIAS